MNDYFDRLVVNSPTVVLGLVAFVEAICLENWVDATLNFDWVTASPIETLFVGGILITILVGIIYMWSIYGTVYVGLKWVPHPIHLINPFIAGLIQLGAISFVASGSYAMASLVYGVLSLLGGLQIADTIKTLSKDTTNLPFINEFPWRIPAGLNVVLGLMLIGVWMLGVSELGAYLAIAAAIVSIVLTATWISAWWRIVAPLASAEES